MKLVSNLITENDKQFDDSDVYFSRSWYPMKNSTRLTRMKLEEILFNLE